MRTKQLLTKKSLYPAKSRNGDYTLLDSKVFDRFKIINAPESYFNICGNISEFTNYDDIANMISAPYLLSTLCAMFNGLKIQAQGQTGYKITWETWFKHKKTGFYLYFYDYKGASSFGSNCIDNQTEKEKDFIDDLNELLRIIVHPKFPHPYDGCVIGEIA